MAAEEVAYTGIRHAGNQAFRSKFVAFACAIVHVIGDAGGKNSFVNWSTLLDQCEHDMMEISVFSSWSGNVTNVFQDHPPICHCGLQDRPTNQTKGRWVTILPLYAASIYTTA